MIRSDRSSYRSCFLRRQCRRPHHQARFPDHDEITLRQTRRQEGYRRRFTQKPTEEAASSATRQDKAAGGDNGKARVRGLTMPDRGSLGGRISSVPVTVSRSGHTHHQDLRARSIGGTPKILAGFPCSPRTLSDERPRFRTPGIRGSDLTITSRLTPSGQFGTSSLRRKNSEELGSLTTDTGRHDPGSPLLLIYSRRGAPPSVGTEQIQQRQPRRAARCCPTSSFGLLDWCVCARNSIS